jgi:hypothetical protein
VPVIPEKELRNNVAEVLRRAEAARSSRSPWPAGPSRSSAPHDDANGSAAPSSPRSGTRPRPRASLRTSSAIPASSPTHSSECGLLDTSVLIGADEPGELEGAISAASLPIFTSARWLPATTTSAPAARCAWA